ncbi:MAG: ISNCY family transposase [Nitrospira sp.]|nr:ISNCY family transposase [Nitrospira sp.]
MRRTEWLQELRMTRFEEAFVGWTESRLTQDEAARVLGVCTRTFRRWSDRYEEEGLDGLRDKRLTQASKRCAPVDEVLALVARYQTGHQSWNVQHFYTWYRRDGGGRSYTWVKTRLQAAGVVPRARRRGVHRQRREAAPWPGMLLHQDGSRHEWVPGQLWDLIVTMDDAINEHYSLFFCAEEGTWSSLRGVREVLEAKGVFCSLYTDRGSHDWHTPVAGGQVDKRTPTQFGRAMAQLGIEMIPAYSPQARGRSERAFKTHQDRLVKELAAAGITDMARANAYLRHHYRPAFNAELARPAREAGSAFVACPAAAELDAILCEQYERRVGSDNCVRFHRLVLQIPPDRYRCHYVKATVTVLQHPDGWLAIRHGPRELARYDRRGKLLQEDRQVAA